MRLLALVPSIYDTSPGQRYRIEQWQSRLNELGVDITFAAFEDKDLNVIVYARNRWLAKTYHIGKAFFRRVSQMKSVPKHDLVYVFREASLLGPPVFEYWIHHVGVPLIFDFDDALFVPYRSPSNGWLSLLKMPSKTQTICKIASHVIAGNQYLADYARRVNPNVTVVPTTIDTDKYFLKPRQIPDIPVIGWTGSHSTLQHLDMLRPTLKQLATRERFRLRVIGTSTYEMEGVDVETVPWRSSSEVDDLRAVDIGVMPLPDHPWNRGKCGCKALQYMALGIPTVCSPVGVNTDIIHDGANGFLARTQEEWIKKLTFLLRSTELRARLGRAGRDTVEQRFSAAVQVPRIYELLQAVYNCSQNRPMQR
jgi:glycosyltransferase involved in cell wall biosynthesis